MKVTPQNKSMLKKLHIGDYRPLQSARLEKSLFGKGGIFWKKKTLAINLGKKPI